MVDEGRGKDGGAKEEAVVKGENVNQISYAAVEGGDESSAQASPVKFFAFEEVNNSETNVTSKPSGEADTNQD